MTIDLFIQIDRKSPLTLHQQIRQQIIWKIVSGGIKIGQKLPSIRALADRLGVSLHTVRHAYQQLESEGLVETRQGFGTRVIPFSLSDIIKSSSTIRSHTVGVIVPSWDNPFYHSFLQGAEEIAQQDQTLFFLCLTHDDPVIACRILGSLMAKGVDGVLLVSHDLSSIVESSLKSASFSQLPLVSADAPGCEGYVVQLDLEGAGYQATQHLVDLGHERIALITHSQEFHNVTPVNKGYQRALDEAGIDIDPNLICRVPGFDFSAGEHAAQKLLTLGSIPSAIFAITDLMALGAMQAVQKAGLRIPGDMSIVGFNDIPKAELVDPPLTTVKAPSFALGQEAMKMLLQLINGFEPTQREIILHNTLIVRHSSTRFVP
jgi:DNA-binding LacI/PurR family transcriptional regulator